MANRFLNVLLRTFAFMAILVLLCFVIRIAFILYLGVFHGALWNGGDSENLISQIGLSLYNGLIHDNRGVAVFTIPFFLIAIWSVFVKKSQQFDSAPPPKHYLLDYYAYFIFGLFLFISIANFTYYTIYQDVFILSCWESSLMIKKQF